LRAYVTAPDPKAVALSGRLFGRLLAAYPKAHRRKYGPAMAQLFRDQCRDAWHAAGGWGITCLWLRVLPDLVKSSVSEHISTLKERIAMLDRISSLLRPRSAPVFVFLAVFIAVFFLVVVATTAITFTLPDTYASTARVLVRQELTQIKGGGESLAPAVGRYDPYFIQTQFELLQSQAILGTVIDNLNLNSVWGKRFAGGGTLKTSESLTLLKARLDLHPVRNTSLIEIRAYTESAAEAAMLANAIAQTYRDWAQSRKLGVEIVDTAYPGWRPVRPNKPANIFFGVVGGIILASLAGGVMAVMTVLFRGSRTNGSPGAGAALPKDPSRPGSSPGKSTRNQLSRQTATSRC
jgi:capsular polysaccharide biosynthesis protein